MRILIFSEYYFPDNFRINDVAEAMVEQEHMVSAVTGLPDYESTNIPSEYRFFKRRSESVKGVNVIRVSTIARRNNVFFRVMSYLSYAVSASIYALFSPLKVDALFVYQMSPVFQIIPALITRWKTKSRLTVYCCDLWPESLKAWGIKENHFIFRIVKALSGWLYRRCDTIAITSRPFRQYLVDLCGVDPSKITYLPQHAEDIYVDICGQYEDNGCIDFLFAGNIGAVQNVDCILNAAANVKASKKFCIHIVGDGSELANCKLLAEKLALDDKVIFYGRFPTSEMPRFYKMADCFLLTLRGGDFIGLTLPAKAQGYLSAGKPILAAIDGAGAEMIAESGCGEAVAAGDFQALSEKMKQMIEDFEPYKAKGAAGRKFYEDHYTKEIFINNLVEILK